MTHETLQALKDGAMDALRLYAALILAPFFIGKSFVMRPAGEPFQWRLDGERTPSETGDTE